MIPLIGWEKDVFLLMKMPYYNEKPAPVKSQDTCIVRFVKDGTAYGFKANVLTVQFFPTPLLFMKYPNSIEIVPFRKTKRFRTNIPARLLDTEKLQTQDAMIVDISESGCLLKVKKEEDSGFEVLKKLYLTFKIMDRSLELDCIVRNIRMHEDFQYFGMSFSAIHPSQQEKIKSFISFLGESSF